MITTIPRTYIACIASYNEGILHGDWIDLDGTCDIEEEITRILKSSPIAEAEEWAVHDHEECGHLSEYPGLDGLLSIESAYEETQLHDIDWEIYCEYCSHLGNDPSADHIDSFQNQYAGQADSLIDWCRDFLEGTGDLLKLPDNLQYYFDFSAFARDMEINDVFTISDTGNTHVFWNC